MTKRGGRGHDPRGIGATTRGSLAVICRACPQPGINLPEGWENAPLEMRLIYFLFLQERPRTDPPPI